MTTAPELLTALFVHLNENCEYAVLRNFEGLPEKNNSRDIDIIIERKSYKKEKKNLIVLLEKHGWNIITYLNSDRVVTWVCGCIDSDSSVEIIQLDFFFNTSLFGIRLINTKEFLANREFNGKIYHVNKEHEFLDKYMYDRAVGVQYPEKYRHVKEAVTDSRLVAEKLKKVFGAKSIEECDKRSGKRMLLHAALRNPFASAARFMRFEYHRIRNYLCSCTGFSIGFTGPDGSGKTTVIDTILERIAPVFGTAHKYYHSRPMLIGNLGEVAHSAGIKKEVDRNYSDPHRGKKTGKINSFLRICYYSVDYIAGYFIKVKSVTRITRVVVFDRYYTDFICDSRRSRIYLNHKFLYWWGKMFIPSLDYNILLTASSETILARKRELDEDGIRTINAKIDYLAGKKGYTKVLNESTPQAAVYEILDYVFKQQHKKNLKRLR